MDNQVKTAYEHGSRTVKRDSALVLVTRLAGNGSLFLMTIFLLHGSFNLVDLGLGEYASPALNACLSLVFFVQHSGMIRQPFRQWLGQSIQEKYHGALYTIASSILLVTIVCLWQKSDWTIVSAQGWLRWTLRGVFVCSFLGFYWGLRSLGRCDLFGIDGIRKNAAGNPDSPGPLRVRGPYRWVRHPLYLFTLLMMWTCPDLTGDRLLFNLLWSGWIVAGTILEERDLVVVFGEEYRLYQKEVPMLIPTSIRPAR